MSCCFLVIDFLSNKKGQSLETQVLVSDVIATIMGLFLSFVGCLGKKESEEILVFKEPLLNGVESNKSNVGESVAPCSNASGFSILTFSWMSKLIGLGYKKALDLEDVPQLAGVDSVKGAFPVFRNKLVSDSGSRITTIKLVKALVSATWREILLTAFLALVYTLASYVGPYLIDTFVQYLNGRRAFKNEGYLLVSTFSLRSLLSAWHRGTGSLGCSRRGLGLGQCLLL
ncbi:multidrug resistance-associated protein 8 [Actinidia rufa]|uniref:Multidrug resistance-associated protein 8 n=1 Tax=Actinidia rufa TaxID=165716 RepID=A0A7J0HEG8_9ERIC|nr:multidrug resistance-associated protein 8 [Actinidia rufa]